MLRCWVILGFALLFASPSYSQSCVTLNSLASSSDGSNYTSVCSTVLNYTQVYLNTTATPCQGIIENAFSLVTAFASSLSSGCSSYFVKYACASLYPPCGFTSQAQALPPSSLSTEYSTYCTGTDLSVLNVASNFLNNLSVNPPITSNSSLATFQFNSSGGTLLPPAQTSVPSCTTYTGTACSNIVTYPIYVQNSATIATAEAVVNALTFLNAVVPFGCKDIFHQLMCYSFFPGCDNVASSLALSNVTIPFPTFPTQSLCNAVNSQCGINPTGVAWINEWLPLLGYNSLCSSTKVFNRTCSNTTISNATVSYALPVFQSSSGYSVGPLSVLPISTLSSPPSATYSCPYPTVIPTNQAVNNSERVLGGACAAPCPILLYDSSQYKASDGIMIGLSLPGLILCTLHLFTFVLFKKTRKKLYPIFFTANIWAVCLVLFFTVAVTNNNNSEGIFAGMQCVDNSTSNYGGYCLFQAIIILFCAFSASAWWCIQAVDLVLNIVLQSGKWSPQRRIKLNIFYYTWAFGWPFIMTIIVAALGGLGNQGTGLPYCFIVNENVSWGVFYAPIGLFCVIGCASMITIIVIIFRSSAASGAHKKKGGYRIYIRPVLFIFVFLFVWVLVFSYRFSEHFNETDYTNDGNTWIECVLIDGPSSKAQNLLNPSYPINNCTVQPKSNVALWYLVQFVVAGVGIWTFILYVTWENCVMWYHWILCKPYNFSRTAGSESDPTDLTGDSAHKSTGSGRPKLQQGKSGHKLVKSSSNKSNTSSGTVDSDTALRYGQRDSDPVSPTQTTDVTPQLSNLPSMSSIPLVINEDPARYSSASVPPTPPV